MTVAASTIYTNFNIGRDQASAVGQVQNAGYWITRDVFTAQNVVLDTDPGTVTFLTLTVPDGLGTKTLVYELQDQSNGLKKMVRVDQGTGAEMLVAENIYYDPVGDPTNSTIVLSYADSLLNLQVTSTYGNATATREYEAAQRVPSP
jgi:hypothetical protein